MKKLPPVLLEVKKKREAGEKDQENRLYSSAGKVDTTVQHITLQTLRAVGVEAA